MWNLKKNSTDELTEQKQNHRYSKQTWLPGREWGRNKLGNWGSFFYCRLDQLFWTFHWVLGNLNLLYIKYITNKDLDFPGGTVLKNPPTNTEDERDMSSIPGLQRSPGEGNGNPLQYSCLKNSMDRGTWQVTVQWDAKSWKWLRD